MERHATETMPMRFWRVWSVFVLVTALLAPLVGPGSVALAAAPPL